PAAFEIVLPITVLVLSDDDFVQDDGEERGAELEKEAELGQSVFLKSSERPSREGKSDSEENRAPSHEGSGAKCSEVKHVTESRCSGSGSSLSDHRGAGEDDCGPNHVLPPSPYKTDLAEGNEASDRKEHDGDDGFQKIPPLFSAGSEGRDVTIKASGELTLAVLSRPEEERVRVANVRSEGRKEEQPEIHRAAETKDPDYSENGDNEAGDRNRERSKSGDETLGSFLEHGLEEGLKLPSNCSPLLNGMIRHSYSHRKPYFCEFCQLAFTSTAGLKRHRTLHASTEPHQGQQLDFVRERKRTLRPLKSYTCDECHVVFYTREHLDFHKKCHEQFKATAKIYTNQSNEYQKSKICKADCRSQDRISLSLSGNGNASLGGGMLASEGDLERAGDVHDDKKLRSGKRFPKNNHGSNSLPVIANRSEVPLNSYEVDAAVFKEEPLLSCQASYSQVQDDDAYHRFGENLKDVWPHSLSAFKMYKCEHCDFATALHGDLKLHLQIHTDKRPFGCKERSKTFETSNHLQKHSLTHVKNGYGFDHCLYVDHRLENLGLHHEMHLRLSPERDFGSLESSNSIHSFLGSEVYELKPDSPKGKENGLLAQSQAGLYQCTECDYATYILGNLELHIRTHTGEKPYSCSVCQKKFPRSGNLKLHLRIHTGEKPFKCEQCGVAFRTSSHLKRHLLTHLKLHCRRCKFSTVDKSAFQKHVRAHKKKFKCAKCSVVLPTKKLLEKHKQQHELEI
ncbi:PREDICTED: zinc finger protein 431-like, partial [Apaloderma vittatum]|uniref:zinc finger protein 431-like n=1 Tax=Apaloderma vittatum TaxID=57397 RepID=UPI00052127F7